MRVYIGIWLLVIALIVSGLEGSVFVKMFTRFTEEIFASLISLLYIVESCQMLFSVSGFNSISTRMIQFSTLVVQAASFAQY